ncbi:RagB/SusD family nutrient uptake outer membrane protein [Flavihumibacter sp. UBA7668]|uniref:RagB/SusD family nutrient uptake outer membrane protein n=1 Tax=Flavihumibacter sp. UBA7668 TaxID=1946542 RepID=UPI0025BDD2E3|nr:RagB/SusD family nutrient uptake outer membrane protein [Flavihumibacter sp. UBA7668]
MNKYIYRTNQSFRLVLYLFLTLMGLSCSKILDIAPLDAFSDESVFKDEATLNLFVNGTYVGIGHSFSSDYTLTEGMTDNSYSKYSGEHQAYTSSEINRDNGENITRGLWANSYALIRRVNLFTEQLVNSPIPQNVLLRLEAEMRFIRAFKYAELLKTYGGVPIITSTFALDAPAFEVARNTIDETVSFIVSECDAVISILPAFNATPRGKASKEAAMALKARTLLYAASPLFNPSNDQAKWIAARDANKAVIELPGFDIIDRGTAEDYVNTFNGRNQSEIIFARYFTPTNPQNGNNGSNSMFWPNGFDSYCPHVPTQDLIDQYELVNGKLPLEAGSGYNPQQPYENRDPRFYANFLFNGTLFFDPYSAKAVRPLEYYRDRNDPNNPDLNGRESRGAKFYPDGASATGYNFKKYTVEGLGAYNFGNNRQTNPWIYFRKSEFYLNYAECEIALGNEEAARVAINRIRQKVDLLPITASGEELVQRYRRERRVELIVEDHRLADIRRWKIGPEALNKPAMGVDVYRNGSVMEYEYDFLVDINRRWNDKMYWFPIPFNEIQRSNGKLVQNPGYE